LFFSQTASLGDLISISWPEMAFSPLIRSLTFLAREIWNLIPTELADEAPKG
jgi:hypothetical protein